MEDNQHLVPPPPSLPLVGGVIDPLSLPVPSSAIEPLVFSPPNLGGSSAASSSDIFNNLNSFLADQNNFQRNYAPYTEIGSYDADYTGTNFDRYYNTPRVFNKLGFSPFRNNEQIYNNNMTWWDGFKRASKQSLVQASVSFKGALPWNAWDGEYSDVEGAKRVERSNAIGADTRGTFGAWVNNTIMNFGFTYGILTEIAAEELALFGMSFIPGMQGLSAGRTANNMRRLIQNLGTVGRAVNASVDLAKNIREINHMRDVYKAMKAAKLPRVFTPNLLDATRDIYKATRKGEALYTLANASKAFGGFYRDAREISAALSESKLEAGMVEQKIKQDLTDKYYAQNGRMPDNTESTKIADYAQAAGKETFLWNMPAIYLSNKIVFDKAFRGFVPFRVLRAEAERGLSGKLVFNEMWFKEGGDPLKLISNSMKDRARMLLKPKMWKPKNLTKDLAANLFVYSKANLSEGLQEIYQEGVSPAMERYYMDKYNNPNVWASKSTWGMFMEEEKKLLSSKQGLEIFGSGFVMGGLIQTPQKMIFQYIPEKFMALTNKTEYDNYVNQRQANSKAIVDSMNYIIKANPSKYFDAVNQNASAQANLERDANMANEMGDRLAFHDTVDEMMGEHIYTLLHHGKIDFLKDILTDMSKMTPEDLQHAFGPVEASEGDPGEFYSKKINNLKDYIETIEKRYEYTNENFVNPFDASMIDKEKDPDLHSQMYVNQIGFERYKKLATLSGYHYDRTIQRMNSIYRNWLANPTMASMNSTDLSLLFSASPKFAKVTPESIMFQTGVGSLVSEIQRLKREIDVLSKAEITTPEGKKDLKEKKRQYELLDKYQELVNVQYLPLLKEYKQALAEGKQEDADRKEEALEGIVSRMKSVYTDYMLFVAEKSGLDPNDLYYTTPQGKRVLTPTLEDSFTQLKDFYTLSNDRADLIQAINVLHNPDIMMVGVRSQAQIAKLELEQFEANMQKWWDVFQQYADSNALLDELSKAGVFFDPQYIDDFKEGRLGNIVFYYHNGKQFIDIRQLQEPQLTTVRNAIDSVLDKLMMVKSLSGRPLFTYRPEGGFTYGSRGKMKTDQRSVLDLSKEFGFNPQASETAIPVRQVLQKVIDSQYSTAQERILAKRLMDLIPEVVTVKFKPNQTVPGTYSEATGIVIDPRYSSVEYKGGGDPIEVNILQQVAKAVMANELAKDSAFKTKIGEMLTAAKAFQSANAATYSQMVGLKDELEFVGAALANPSFQTMLGQVEYQPTGKSVWQEFMDALKEFLSKVFKAPKESSLLEEAMYVITSKLGGEGAITEQTGAAPVSTQQATTQTRRAQPLSWLSDINDLKPIWPSLLTAYKTEEQQREKDGFSPLTVGWATMSDIDILNSPGFRSFLETTPALNIINQYNVDQGLVPKTAGGTITIKNPTMDQREKLKDLGYTPEQIAKFDFVTAADLIARDVRATTEADRLAALAAIEQETIKKLVADFYDSYNAIDPQAEGAREALFQWLSDVKNKDRYEDYLANGINSQVWERMFQEKLAQLPRIDRLEIGKIYKVDGTLYKVTGSKDEVYNLVRFDELALSEEQRSEPLKLERKDLNAMNIISSDMVETPTVVDKEATDAINNNAEGLTPEQKAEAQNNAADVDDLDFDPCG